MIKSIKNYFLVIAFAISTLFSVSAFADDQSKPEVVVQKAIDTTIKIFDANANNLSTKNEVLREQVKNQVFPYFQNKYIALSILGQQANSVDKSQFPEYQTAIDNYMINAYIEGLSFYKGQKVSVGAPTLKGNLAEVSVTVPNNGSTINVTFKLFNYKGEYKIIDFVAEGISIVQTKATE